MSNYCLVKKNRIYENLYDTLESEELSMEREKDTNKIKYILKDFVKKFEKKSIIYKNVDKEKTLIEDIIENFLEEEDEYETQGNTILCQIYENFMYEIIYSENLDNSIIKKDENLNEFLSICNINMEPIYKSGVLIKTIYNDDKLYNENINITDLERILINNFYYRGVVIDDDNNNNNIKEIEFTGENITKIIGNTFELDGTYEVFELTLVIYKEKNNDQINKYVSKILNKETKGRIFIGLLCPISKKKYMHMTSSLINKIYNIMIDEEKSKKLRYELHSSDKLMNPLIFIEKYK